MEKLFVFLVLSVLTMPAVGFGATQVQDQVSVQALKLQVESLLKQIEVLTIQINQIRAGATISQPATISGGVSVGSSVTTIDRLKVRDQANGSVLGVVEPGAVGTVVGSGVNAGGYVWVKVRYSNGLEGYSAKDWLQPPVVSRPTPPLGELPPYMISEPVQPEVPPTVAPRSPSIYACGDVNADGYVNKNDIATYTSYIFYGGVLPKGVTGDLNGSGFPDAVDLAVLIDFVNGAGPMPKCDAANVPPTSPAGIKSVTSVNACADFSADGKVDMADVNTYSNYIFYGGKIPTGLTGDLNGSGFPDAVDLAILIDYVNGSGSVSCQPEAKLLEQPKPAQVYACGDINGDGVVGSTDITSYTNYIFYGGKEPAGGQGDLDGSGFPDAADLAVLADYVNAVGPAPRCGAATAVSVICGDINRDSKVNLLDVNYLRNYIFYGAILPAGVSGDVDGSGFADATDLAFLADYTNGSGKAPVCSGTNTAGVPRAN